MIKRIASVALLVLLGTLAQADSTGLPVKGTALHLAPQAGAPPSACLPVGQVCIWYDSTAGAWKARNAAGTDINVGGGSAGTLTASSPLTGGGAMSSSISVGVDTTVAHCSPTTSGDYCAWNGASWTREPAPTGGTLQQSYTAGAAGGGALDLSSSGGGLVLRDAATPLGAPLLDLTDHSGAVHYFSADAGPPSLNFSDGATAALSAAGTGRLIYNNTTHTFQVSTNAGAYGDLGGFSGGSVSSFVIYGGTSSATVTPSWTAPTLGASWVDFGAPYVTTGYYKDANGLVHIKGLIKSGTVGTGTPVFTLPAGYRPAETLYLPAVGGNSIGVLQIDSSGNVFAAVSAAGNSNFSLQAVFPAEL